MRQRNLARKIKFLKKNVCAKGPVRCHFSMKKYKKIFLCDYSEDISILYIY